MDYKCHKCSHKIVVQENMQIGFKDYCEKCSSDLHACLNCEFYEKNSYNECRESSAERVVDKEKGNYCDLFRFRAGGKASALNEQKSDVKKKLDDLFK
jgi:hypothetical protein